MTQTVAVMPRWKVIVFLCLLLPAIGRAESAANYSLDSLASDVALVHWDASATFGGVSLIGFTRWNWGSSSFRLQSEGWFGENTAYGGVDKLGHLYSAYTMTNVFAERMVNEGADPASAALSGTILAQGITLYIEIFDGLSNEHGFAWEDEVMNLLGGGLAYLRQRYPAVKEAVDYRLEYERSGYKGYDPLSDYAGQKYLLALKLAPLCPCLSYLELQAGYYAHGFTDAEIAHGVEMRRQGFVGVGLNFSRLLFGAREGHEELGRRAGRFFFEHIQLPQTSLRSRNER